MNAAVPTQEQLYRGGWRYVTVTTGLVVRPHPLVARGWTFGGTQAGIVRLPDARILPLGFQLILVNESTVAHAIQRADSSELIGSFAADIAYKASLVGNSTAAGVWITHGFSVL